MLESYIVLTQWCVNNICVYLSVFLWYCDFSARIWTR